MASPPLEGNKRARDDDAYEVELGGVSYVILEKLYIKYKMYFDKNKLRSPAALGVGREVFFVKQTDVQDCAFKSKPKYATKGDYRLAEKSAIASLIADADACSLPRAPKVITDEDLLFFVDPETDLIYRVEMRGERTRVGIYFKAKDVGVVFKVKTFVKNVLDPRSSFKEGCDYVWFAVHDPQPATADPHSATQNVETLDISQDSASDTSRQGPRRVLYLTFSGLIHAIHVTRSSAVAHKFREWVEKAVFAVAYGTEEQKEDFLTSLSKTDKVTWKIMSKITHQIMCIYLLETPKRDGDAKVYTFGKAEHFRERFLEHVRDYGDGIQLEHLVLLPADKLYEAETTLKKSLMEHSRFRLNNKLEEISLDASELDVVRTIMQTISDRFLGQSLIISTSYEMLILNKEREVAVLTEKLASAQEKLVGVEEMYRDNLVKVEEISQLRLQVVDLQKRALQAEVDNLKRENDKLKTENGKLKWQLKMP